MNAVILGNIVSFIAATIMVLLGFIRERKKILLVQCLQFAVFAASNLILKGYSGVIVNCINIVRNLRFLKSGDIPLWEKLLYPLIQAVLTAMFNDLGFVGWFPVIGSALLTLALAEKSEIRIKVIFIITLFLWVFFDWSIKSYVACAFDVFSVISNLIGIFSIKKSLKARSERDEIRKTNPDY